MGQTGSATHAHAAERTPETRPWSPSHDAPVDVELLLIPECPGAEEASEVLRTALDDIGLSETPFTVRIIESEHNLPLKSGVVPHCHA